MKELADIFIIVALMAIAISFKHENTKKILIRFSYNST